MASRHDGDSGGSGAMLDNILVAFSALFAALFGVLAKTQENEDEHGTILPQLHADTCRLFAGGSSANIIWDSAK